MFKLILLLTPVYITLFWSLVLNTENGKTANTPKIYLGKFMIVAFFVYVSHCLYFIDSFKDYYSYIDPIYQYASLIVYPMFHVYVRLLTIETKYSIKKQGKYFIPSTLLFACYTLGLLFNLPNKIMEYITLVIKFTFVVQVIVSVFSNYRLINKYGDRAQHYYSNMEDSNMDKIKMLNVLMLITAISSVTLGIIGGEFFYQNIHGLSLASFIFSLSLFLIGWLGNRQNVINPTFEEELSENDTTDQEYIDNEYLENDLDYKLTFLLKEKKIFLNNKLTIRDLTLSLGTNRTELSKFINKRYNRNFCSYINSFRVNELQKIKSEHPNYSTSMLAELSGFGSIDSMRRALKNEKDILKEIFYNKK